MRASRPGKVARVAAPAPEASTPRLGGRWQTPLVVIYAVSALSWSMPAGLFPGKQIIDRIAAAPFMALGLWQAWDMFSPDPRTEDICVEIVSTDRNGGRERRMLTDMVAMGYPQRWQKDRWRKYFNDHLRLDAESVLWQPFAEYAVRRLRDEGHEPVMIELVRWWRPVESPMHPGLRADVRVAAWQRYRFHGWSVPSGWER